MTSPLVCADLKLKFVVFVQIFIVLSLSQSMELVGGNEMKLSPLKKEKMTYVFPNKVSFYGIPIIFLKKKRLFKTSLSGEKKQYEYSINNCQLLLCS